MRGDVRTSQPRPPASVVAAQLIAEPEGPRTHLGESPRWDGSSWWWVDAATGDVWLREPGSPALLAHRTGRRTSLVQPDAAGRVVIAREQTIVVLGPRVDQVWEIVGTWSDLYPSGGWRLNDGTADAVGRLWVGSIAPGRARNGGELLRVDHDGTVTRAASGFTLSNGMAWDAAGTTLYHVDTLERTVWAHQVDIATGEVVASEAFVTFDRDDGLPDGIATDVDAGVWVAVYGRGEARRYDAHGDVTQVITVEPPQCTSIALGGPDGRDVLITTAREGYDDARSLAEPTAGRLYRARTTVPGVPTLEVSPGASV